MTLRQLQSIAKAKGLEVKVSTPIGMARLPRNGKGPQVLTDAELRWSVELSLPCRVLSESNQRNHWTVANRRKRTQNVALRTTLMRVGLTNLPLPCVVTWTHIGPEMDKHENLPRAFKGLTDSLAEWLGIDDADPRVMWAYDQKVGPPGVEVRIESHGS